MADNFIQQIAYVTSSHGDGNGLWQSKIIWYKLKFTVD